MKNTNLFIIMMIIIVLVGIFLYRTTAAITGNAVNNGNSGGSEENYAGNGNTQKITLSMRNYNYYPNTVNVKANQPVEITLDENVFGCLRSFAIKELGVRKYAKTPNDKIVFTPTQTGTFTFSCSMGMGYGKLIVG